MKFFEISKRIFLFLMVNLLVVTTIGIVVALVFRGHVPRGYNALIVLCLIWGMGAPLFLFYFLFSFHSRVMPNWIAPSIIPLFCLMVIYFGERWSRFKKPITPWFITGVVIGLCSVILAHDHSGKRCGCGSRHCVPQKTRLFRQNTARVPQQVISSLRAC